MRWQTLRTAIRKSLHRLASGLGDAIVPAASQEASGLHELGWRVDCYDRASASVVMTAAAAKGIAAVPLTVPPVAPDC